MLALRVASLPYCMLYALYYFTPGGALRNGDHPAGVGLGVDLGV